VDKWRHLLPENPSEEDLGTWKYRSHQDPHNTARQLLPLHTGLRVRHLLTRAPRAYAARIAKRL
jgi:hypothetical protein